MNNLVVSSSLSSNIPTDTIINAENIRAAIFGLGEYCRNFLKTKITMAIPKINNAYQNTSEAVNFDQKPDVL